jgi:DNA-binding response OmpR family regulator/HPt (histidine-containing phosphotransfer) domain-containing protein
MEEAPVRILVVDDNPGDARLVEYALTHEPEGTFRCERASRIAAALEQLGKSEFDAVLLDLGLPDSQGTDGLRRIQERAPNLAVIVLTGSENPALVRAAIAAGAQDYLVKGIFPRGLLARVIRVAIHHTQIEARLGAHELPDERSLTELNRLGEGVLVLDDRASVAVNAAFGELTGYSAGAVGEPPAWLTGIASGAVGTDSRGRLDREGSPTILIGAGELVVDRPDGRPAELEYVVRQFPGGNRSRTVVFLRALSHERRGTGGAAAGNPTEPSERAAGGTTAAEGPIDEATWVQLRELAGTDATFLPALVAAFLEEGRRLLQTLESAAQRGDAPALIRAAHSLKSSCAQLGALALSRHCAALEMQGEAGDLTRMRALVAQIARDFPEVANALAKRYPKR